MMRASSPNVAEWSTASAVLFRFAVFYLGLFSMATQIAGSLLLIPGWTFRGFGSFWPMRAITSWIGTSLLGVDPPLDFSGANGETVAFWIQTAWILGVAVAGTMAWTAVARGKTDYSRAHEWFRLGVRLALAGQMFEYGITKIIPNQFEAPALAVLVTPAGDLSLNTLLWTTIGASPGYQMTTGWAELVAGILLILPTTVLLGALISLVDMIHVFVLNMAFDIGLKLTTIHLIVLALVLIVPDLGRLWRFFVRNEAVRAPYPARRLFGLGARAFVWAPLLVGAYLVGVQVLANVNFWYADGGGAPRSALYGIWDVEEMSVAGVTGPVALLDYDRRWRRLIFDRAGTLALQRTDDSLARFESVIDESNRTMTLSRPVSPSWSATFRFERDGGDRMTLEGAMDGLPIRAVLRRRDEDTFRVLNSRFRWVRPATD